MPAKLKESIVKELRRLSMKNDDDDDDGDGHNVSEEWKKRFMSLFLPHSDHRDSS